MSDFKPRPGTFLPYLEYANREKLGQRAQASPLTLLEILARQAQYSLPMFDLQTLSGLDPSRYAEALKSLRDAGYITIAGEAPDQAVQLTDGGAKVVQLARPA
jgi:DNA-binding IclR family transcriptional regulator